ncbi:G-protein coupled receptor 64 [Pteropus alecto]|uniref:G-protein coupled receptor 64 n=1 Tax=Pteropus alecto TaxID=9402 RepID=L5KMP6_PTEAL|nr:G-protein coupled receptor 64 [Pteropus alecto]
MFQYDEESNVTQNQNMANVTLTGVLYQSELKQSELNKTLQTLSETYFVACDKDQSDLQDPVTCLPGHPRGPPFSSGNSIPVAPQATVISRVSSAFSFAEPLNHPPVTQSPTGVTHLPSLQPSAPITSSRTIDIFTQSGILSSSMPQTHLSRTLPPVKSPLPSPTTSAPLAVITTSTPPDKTEIVHTSSISVSDLENQVSQMEKVLSLGSLEPNLAREMISQVSKLLHSPPALLAPLAQRLLKVVEDIGLQVNFSTKIISLTSPSLALAVSRVNASNFDTTTFAAQDPENLQVSLETEAPENSIGVITLPSSLMSNLPANDVELASRVQFNFFETPTLFQDPALENLSLISYVISSSVANLTVKNLTRNVTVTLKHIDQSQDDLTVRCVFWDLSRNGVPAVVVTIVLTISPDNYGLGSYGKFPSGSSDDFCWINSNAVFYITVVGYFCVIFLLNVSMFIVVLVQLCRIKKKKQLGAQRKTSIQDLRSVAGLTFLLGITWGFAFFAWGPVNIVFMYLFAIFNTLQDWSKTATNGLKKQTINQGVSSSSNSLQSNSNSTHSTTLLVNNDCSGLVSGNGNASTEKNGVSFSVQNGDVCLHDFTGKQHVFHEKEDSCNGKSRIALRRTSKRGSLHFIEQM